MGAVEVLYVSRWNAWNGQGMEGKLGEGEVRDGGGTTNTPQHTARLCRQTVL